MACHFLCCYLQFGAVAVGMVVDQQCVEPPSHSGTHHVQLPLPLREDHYRLKRVHESLHQQLPQQAEQREQKQDAAGASVLVLVVRLVPEVLGWSYVDLHHCRQEGQKWTQLH